MDVNLSSQSGTKKIICTKKVYDIDDATQFLLPGLIKQTSLWFRRKSISQDPIKKLF